MNVPMRVKKGKNRIPGGRGKVQEFIGARFLIANRLRYCGGNNSHTAQQNQICDIRRLPHDFQVIPAGLKSKWDESCISKRKKLYFW